MPEGANEYKCARVDAGGKTTQNGKIREAVAGRGLCISTRKLLEKVLHAHAALGGGGGLTLGGNKVAQRALEKLMLCTSGLENALMHMLFLVNYGCKYKRL